MNRAAHKPIYCLSVQAPWSWLICHGGKDIENRTRRTHYRGPVLIHASKQLAPWPAEWTPSLKKRFGIELPDLRAIERGGIVGIAEIVDCVSSSDSPWFMGPFGYVLRNQRPLPFFPCKGALGFFTPPEHFDVPDLHGPLRTSDRPSPAS